MDTLAAPTAERMTARRKRPAAASPIDAKSPEPARAAGTASRGAR